MSGDRQHKEFNRLLQIYHWLRSYISSITFLGNINDILSISVNISGSDLLKLMRYSHCFMGCKLFSQNLCFTGVIINCLYVRDYIKEHRVYVRLHATRFLLNGKVYETHRLWSWIVSLCSNGHQYVFELKTCFRPIHLIHIQSEKTLVIRK